LLRVGTASYGYGTKNSPGGSRGGEDTCSLGGWRRSRNEKNLGFGSWAGIQNFVLKRGGEGSNDKTEKGR